MNHGMFLSLFTVASVWGVDSPTRQVAVEITHEKGSFSGQLSVALNGSMNKAKATWNASIRNTSQTKIFRVTFCVKAFDSSDQEIKPGWERLRHSAVEQQLGAGCVLDIQGQPEHQQSAKTRLRFRWRSIRSQPLRSRPLTQSPLHGRSLPIGVVFGYQSFCR